MKGELMNLTKLLVASSGTSAVAHPLFQILDGYVQQPVWGVPVTVFGAAACGAAMSLFFGDPLPSRRALFGQTLSATIFGAGLAVLLSDAMNWVWATKHLEMFALVCAAMIRWFLPTIIERTKQLIKSFTIKIPLSKRDNEPGNEGGGE